MDCPLIDIEGVGPKYAAKFKEAGLTTTYDLILHGETKVCRLMKGVLTEEKVAELLGTAHTLLLGKLGPQEAEALALAGKHTWASLTASSPEVLLKAFQDAKERKKIKEVPSEARVAEWQREAVKFRNTYLIRGRVSDKEGKALVGANLSLGTATAQTNASGVFVLAGVHPWDRILKVEKEGFYSLDSEFNPPKKEAVRLDFLLQVSPEGAKSPIIQDEAKGHWITFVKGDRYERHDVEISALPDGTPLVEYLVGKYNDGMVRLVSVNRRREGRVIHTYRVKVKPDEIRGGTPDGKVVFKTASGLERSDKTRDQYFDEKFLAQTKLDPKKMRNLEKFRRTR